MLPNRDADVIGAGIAAANACMGEAVAEGIGNFLACCAYQLGPTTQTFVVFDNYAARGTAPRATEATRAATSLTKFQESVALMRDGQWKEGSSRCISVMHLMSVCSAMVCVCVRVTLPAPS